MHEARITVKRLHTAGGYYHIRGVGPCNWAQPPCWPCDERTLRRHAFPEASEEFVQECLVLLRKDDDL